MKAIMYHYVREYKPELPKFRFLDIQNFRKQLDYFEQKFGFVSRKDWDLVIQKKKLGSAEGKVVLTFDDSLSCHFDYVFPELKKRNLWGIFYDSNSTIHKIKDVRRTQSSFTLWSLRRPIAIKYFVRIFRRRYDFRFKNQKL